MFRKIYDGDQLLKKEGKESILLVVRS